MNNIYKIIITTIIIIILFFIFLFQEEMNKFFMNLTMSSSNTRPSDCPDYWIKYSNHKNSSGDDLKYGCYIDAKKQPDVVYNGGRCNYINGVRTNFGTMPNYCDLSQNNAVGNNLNLTNTRSGIELIDGWQSFFKMDNLPAVLSIAPQQNKSWVPGKSYDGTDESANDDLELRYVALYKISYKHDTGSEIIYTLIDDDPIILSDELSFSGPSYTMTGIAGYINNHADAATILNNYGYSSNLELNYPSNATNNDLTKFYKNIYRCKTDRMRDYHNIDLNNRKIACPTTWRATIPDLPVDTSYVLIYVGGNPSQNNLNTADETIPFVVSIYDKLTKSYITKQVATKLDENTSSIKLRNTGGTVDDFKEKLSNGTNNYSGDYTLTFQGLPSNIYIGYIDIYIPYYDPNTSDGSHNTVAGYEMSVFDNLNYCQKRMWAMKNDIHWSGITDNPTLTRCSEDDFYSPVNFDVSFSLTATLGADCLYYDASGTVDDGDDYRAEGYYAMSGGILVSCNPSSTLLTSITPSVDSFSWADITNF